MIHYCILEDNPSDLRKIFGLSESPRQQPDQHQDQQDQVVIFLIHSTAPPQKKTKNIYLIFHDYHK